MYTLDEVKFFHTSKNWIFHLDADQCLQIIVKIPPSLYAT